MKISRYGARSIELNAEEKYENLFKKRGVKFIEQYDTPFMRYPTADEMVNLNVVSHIWQTGDRYWKLAAKYYSGQSQLWWIIAWFNQAPTEGHLKVGNIVDIPLPLDKILDYLDV